MKLLVLGDQCCDVFVYGSVSRLCPEGPVPVFNPISIVSNEGMAGNVAANLRALGATVDLISNNEVIIKKRLVDLKSNQLIVRIDENDKVANTFDIDRINFRTYDAVIVSDYCKGFLTLKDIYQISQCHKVTFLDTKKSLSQAYMGNYKFIKINESEWQKSMEDGNTLNDWHEQLIVTLGERGCMYNGINYPASDDISVRDVSGAGDSFLAALAFKYVETKSISDSLRFANECAGKVVKKKGVATI